MAPLCIQLDLRTGVMSGGSVMQTEDLPAHSWHPFSRAFLKAEAPPMQHKNQDAIRAAAKQQLRRPVHSACSQEEWSHSVVTNLLGQLLQSKVREATLLHRLRFVDAGHRGCYEAIMNAKKKRAQQKKLHSALRKLA